MDTGDANTIKIRMLPSGIIWESALRDRQANVLLQDHKVYKELINHIIL